MVIQVCEALYADFLQELKAASLNADTDSKHLVARIRICQDYLFKLREAVVKNGFSETRHEIEFFKTLKPKFLSPLIQERAVYQLVINQPKGTKYTLLAYYKAEMEQIAHFFKVNRFQYDYYRRDMVELDHLYFVRGVAPSSSHYCNISAFDPDFSTGMDFLFAEFQAYEAVQDIILERIAQLMDPNTGSLEKKQRTDVRYGLKWTGESINLVELAYGLWLTGQLNHGNASVSEIIRWLEGSLDIHIGRAYRRWTEISRRERVHATKYVDRMREAIITRLQNEDDLQFQKRQVRKKQ